MSRAREFPRKVKRKLFKSIVEKFLLSVFITLYFLPGGIVGWMQIINSGYGQNLNLSFASKINSNVWVALNVLLFVCTFGKLSLFIGRLIYRNAQTE